MNTSKTLKPFWWENLTVLAKNPAQSLARKMLKRMQSLFQNLHVNFARTVHDYIGILACRLLD